MEARLAFENACQTSVCTAGAPFPHLHASAGFKPATARSKDLLLIDQEVKVPSEPNYGRTPQLRLILLDRGVLAAPSRRASSPLPRQHHQ